MPDALSKTVPIWCAVMNRALFPAETAYHAVKFPPEYLPASEESQIEKRIDGFVQSLKVIHHLPTFVSKQQWQATDTDRISNLNLTT